MYRHMILIQCDHCSDRGLTVHMSQPGALGNIYSVKLSQSGDHTILKYWGKRCRSAIRQP